MSLVINGCQKEVGGGNVLQVVPRSDDIISAWWYSGSLDRYHNDYRMYFVKFVELLQLSS